MIWLGIFFLLCILPQKIMASPGNPYPQSYTDNNGVYHPGNCTWQVWEEAYLRLGVKLPGWGNAGGWCSRAAASGYTVINYSQGVVPQNNCIIEWNGHVAWVISADSVGVNLREGNILLNGSYQAVHEQWWSWDTLKRYRGNPIGFIYLSKPAPADTQSPTISNITISEINRDGYTVTCNVSDNVGVTKVEFPSWNVDRHVGEDAVWLNGNISGNTASVRVNIADLKSGAVEGNYMTHIYASDAAGNRTCCITSGVWIDRTNPIISEVKITNLTKNGYQVNCKVTDNVQDGIDRVQFPTWTLVNDQDDLSVNWQTDIAYSGKAGYNNNIYYFDVKISEHGNEKGLYRTHIYAFDKYGNMAVYDSLNDTNVPDDDTPPIVLSKEITRKDVNTVHFKIKAEDNAELGNLFIAGASKEKLFDMYVQPIDGVYEFDLNLGTAENRNYYVIAVNYLFDVAGNAIKVFEEPVLCGDYEKEIVLKANGNAYDLAEICPDYKYYQTYYDRNFITIENGKIIPLKAGTTDFCLSNNKSGKLAYFTRIIIQDDVPNLSEKDNESKSALVNIWIYDKYTEAYEMLNQLNELRASVGAVPLEMDKTLLEAAMKRAAECQLYFSHTRPDGTENSTILPESQNTSGSENIACGQLNAAAVLDDWKKSAEYYQNMIKKEYTRVGIGCVNQNGIYTWVLELMDGTAEPVQKEGEEFVAANISVLPEYLDLRILVRPNEEMICGKDYVFSLLNYNLGSGFPMPCVIDPDDISITTDNPNVLTYIPDKYRVYAAGSGTATISLTSKLDRRITVSKTYKVEAAAENSTPPKGNSQVGPKPQEKNPQGQYSQGQYSQGQKNEAVRTISKSITLKKVQSESKKKITVTWKKVSRASGYEIRYSTKSNMKSGKTKKVSGAGKTSVTLKKLKAGKKYYVQVRAYQKVNGKTYRGNWSKRKGVKVKK